MVTLAHLVPTGLGPWGDGIARLLLEPTDLLLIGGLTALGVRLGRLVFLVLSTSLAIIFAMMAAPAVRGRWFP